MTNSLRRVKERNKAWKEFRDHNMEPPHYDCIHMTIKKVFEIGFNMGWKKQRK